MVVVVGRLLSGVVGGVIGAVLLWMVSVGSSRWWFVRVVLGGGAALVVGVLVLCGVGQVVGVGL